MVIIFTHNNNNIDGFDFEKMTWFLTKHINTYKVIYMYISISLTKLTLPQKSQLQLFFQNVIFFYNPFTIFGKISVHNYGGIKLWFIFFFADFFIRNMPCMYKLPFLL